MKNQPAANLFLVQAAADSAQLLHAAIAARAALFNYVSTPRLP